MTEVPREGTGELSRVGPAVAYHHVRCAWLAKKLTADHLNMRAQSAFVERRIVQKANGHVLSRQLASLLTNRTVTAATMQQRARALAQNLALLANGRHDKRNSRKLKADRTLQMLVADLIASRTAAGMTQEEVAARMFTTKSVVSRLESGAHTRPTLRTIERYALAVGACVDIRVRSPYRSRHAVDLSRNVGDD